MVNMTPFETPSSPTANPEDAPQPVYLDTSALDFDRVTETFEKIPDPAKAVAIEIATKEQVVEAVLVENDGDETVETVNTAYPGDAIVTGARGRKYVVNEDDLDELYEPLRDETGKPIEGRYLPKNVVKRIKNPTGQAIVIEVSWGWQWGDADCWLVESQINGERYIIGAQAFDLTYRPVEPKSV